MDYTTHVNPRKAKLVTPQSKRASKKQKRNNAGGFTFQVSDWDRLERFLILGTEGGTYYVSESKLTKQNAKNVDKLLHNKEDGLEVVRRVVEISQSGRAPKNDPALFVLAMASASGHVEVRKAALDALPKVARIGTHLFHYAQFVLAFRGWGRALRKAVAKWYNEKELAQLEYQVMKYKQRDGWSHRDLLRLAHPSTNDENRNTLYKFIVDKGSVPAEQLSARMQAAEQLATETDAKTAIKLISEFNLPREVVNTELLKNKKVWDALLQNMPMTAMIRNLGKMGNLGLLDPMSDGARLVIDNVTNKNALIKARIHPLAVLVALNTYRNGHGVRGSLSWGINQDIVDALDEAFYLSFDTIEPTGKRYLLGIDISGSMTWGDIAGLPGINPNVAAAAMAMVTARTEKHRGIMGFSSNFVDLGISPKQRLDQVIEKTQRLFFGRTDCALPMVWALQNKVSVDAFIVYTDNETWYGNIHPHQALREYRNKMGINAKMITVGMVANHYTIADPDDAGMLDVVGFDTATPNVITNFVK